MCTMPDAGGGVTFGSKECRSDTPHKKRASLGSNWRSVPKFAYAIGIEAEWSRP